MKRIEELQIEVVKELLKAEYPLVDHAKFITDLHHLLQASIANEKIREALKE